MTREELRKWRRNRDIYQAEAAKLLGKSKTQYVRYELGEAEIPATVAMACKWLDGEVYEPERVKDEQ